MTHTTTAPAVDQITATDRQLLTLLADGLTQQQIAHRLGRGGSAVNMRMLRIREHLGAATTAHAVAIAYRTGLLDTRDGNR
ncbi:LuxR C-terminal-related transcriptional regulator [Micromonospora sp. NBRC 101691]|uniref:LuxR C-terminal-related transcriptional regulator n=1 Tax=Micromonospora sp. NBRC 101691 TaxID=3032198 RepID=UPI0024A1013A|nr:LuxR C-terminal-related transcriptional regulator [Micromonospora sp. NBRC 101691]GLY21664.1 hypothetical protein Misp04_13960 [Micromonospora sp. NBRC 101691]